MLMNSGMGSAASHNMPEAEKLKDPHRLVRGQDSIPFLHRRATSNAFEPDSLGALVFATSHGGLQPEEETADGISPKMKSRIGGSGLSPAQVEKGPLIAAEVCDKQTPGIE